MNLQLKNKMGIIATILISGMCWVFANDLRGDFGYLMWIAPIGIILLAPDVSGKITFFVAFIAYLIGRMSWFGYLVTVATFIPAMIVTIALPLIFAFIVVLTRKIIVKSNVVNAVLAFPVFFTAFEWLMIMLSPDGSAASIAYSQSNYLPFIQIASITGISGVTFMVTFIPSAIAVGIYCRKRVKELRLLLAFSAVLIASVFLFGIIRMSHGKSKDHVKAGLVVLDEKIHDMSMHPNLEMSLRVAESYAREIEKVASQGVKLVVFPEKGINMSAESDSIMIGMWKQAALQNQVTMVIGYTNMRNAVLRNSSIVISADGQMVEDYDKVHLVKGFEDQFSRGSTAGLFNFKDIQAGTSICKDLDFPGFIRKYGKSEVQILCIPAWDFVVDDWLHSRMAIMRGIENGFSEVRTARLGRLSISDPYGRVIAEANCVDGKATTLVGSLPFSRVETLYSRYGEWFGWLVTAAALYLFFLIFKRKSKKHDQPKILPTLADQEA